jgi:hypothetical protein
MFQCKFTRASKSEIPIIFVISSQMCNLILLSVTYYFVAYASAGMTWRYNLKSYIKSSPTEKPNTVGRWNMSCT